MQPDRQAGIASIALVLCACAVGCIGPRATTAPAPVPGAPGAAPPSSTYPGQQTSFEPPPKASLASTPTPEPLLDEEEDEGPSLSDRLQELSPKKMNRRFKTMIGLGPDEAIAKAHYATAEEHFRNKRYAEAAEEYSKAADRGPDSALEEDAMFMQAECCFLQDKYGKASDIYTNLLKKYENSRHLDKIINRRFAIARYWDQLGVERSMFAFNVTDKKLPFWDTSGNAIALYESIRMDDPSGPLADDATMATANSYFLNGRYEDAAYHYDLLRKNYPQSDFQPQAHLLGMRSKLLAYQGPEYEGKPLSEAEELADQMTNQFPGQLDGERDRIRQTKRAIRAQMAERDWQRAEYYRKGNYNRAAKFYYESVIKEYPDTPFADMSRQRVEEIKDLPPEPKVGMEWISSKFQRDKTTK